MRFLAVLLLALAAAPLASAHVDPPPRWHPPVLHVRPDRRGVPILEYHALGPTGPGLPELYTSRAAFDRQMDWLAAHGYTAVTLDTMWDAWHGHARLPARPVVLSFDDGYPGDYRVALPALARHGWPGVLNFQIGNLLPANVRRLIGAGWEIDAHTFTHPDLTTVGPSQLRREVAGSRAWIRNVFGVPGDFFCYPAGRYDAAVLAEVRAAGYRAGEGETYGLARPQQREALDRIEILASDGLDGFVRKLLGAR